MTVTWGLTSSNKDFSGNNQGRKDRENHITNILIKHWKFYPNYHNLIGSWILKADPRPFLFENIFLTLAQIYLAKVTQLPQLWAPQWSELQNCSCRRSIFSVHYLKSSILASKNVREGRLARLNHFEILLILLLVISSCFKGHSALLRTCAPWSSIWLYP